MGARPHTPIIGIMGMGKHVLSDRLTASGVCGIHSFHIPVIRVWLRPIPRMKMREAGGGCDAK